MPLLVGSRSQDGERGCHLKVSDPGNTSTHTLVRQLYRRKLYCIEEIIQVRLMLVTDVQVQIKRRTKKLTKTRKQKKKLHSLHSEVKGRTT